MLKRFWVAIFLCGLIWIKCNRPDTDLAMETRCKVLFDNSHAQTAGNADWTISGAYSSFAAALKAQGFEVSEWGNAEPDYAPEDDSPINYQALSEVCVLIIPEPNVPFTSKEQQAIVEFVKRGGGLLLLANHLKADRNRNGWDAIEVFNGVRYDKPQKGGIREFVPRAFGFRFLNRNYTKLRGFRILKHPITAGVRRITVWAGTTISVEDHKRVRPVIAMPGKPEAFVVAAQIGKGRVVAIGDSSIADDGTGAMGNRLHDNWTQADNAKLLINSVLWLAKSRNK